MKIKKGDKTLIIKGKYRGKTGKVIKSLPKERRIVVEGVNVVKKRIRGRQKDEKGKTVELSAPIHVSNVKLICPNCKKATMIGYQIKKIKDEKVKVRICKKCKREM